MRAWRGVGTYATATPCLDEDERGHVSDDRDGSEDNLYHVRREPATRQETRTYETRNDDLLSACALEERVPIVILAFPVRSDHRTPATFGHVQ
jgi:hypothetical protein